MVVIVISSFSSSCDEDEELEELRSFERILRVRELYIRAWMIRIGIDIG